MASSGERYDPKAVIGFFVCQKKTVYAVVCKHLTDTANSHLYIQNLQSYFAKRMHKKEESESPTYTKFDIDLIKVKKEHIEKCNPVFRNALGKIKKGRVFEGDVNDSKDREVFTYRNGTVGIGKVLDSSQIEKCLTESYSMDTHFVVGGDSFSDAGDSGRVVAFDDDGFLQLVGIIVHKTVDQSQQTVCLNLRKGLEFLENKYSLKLSLWEQEPERSCKSSQNRWIEPGMSLGLGP